ncbi:hypothetical protein BDA96_09G081600 [Sorghum bicolor]|uniref:Uncharacterized protein n=2 Tax=Sorghum bicolor TaxID=4558 RepID=A0A921U3X0_SORBI|nr:hypothetical protein BDA96_09G081600 [Sorghum bicolor]KAG0517349.1 hypothetical protein BDA96_09G081600 [Sorghum bicolor]OQU77606.1 hypothetical protein SORBI_3009G077250 [Sorghum bicolor]
MERRPTLGTRFSLAGETIASATPRCVTMWSPWIYMTSGLSSCSSPMMSLGLLLRRAALHDVAFSGFMVVSFDFCFFSLVWVHRP